MVNGILKIKGDVIMNNIDLNKYKAKSITVRAKVHEIKWQVYKLIKNKL